MKNRKYIYSLLTASTLVFVACGSDGSSDNDKTTIEVNQSKEHFVNIIRSGGDTTDVQYKDSSHAFSQPAVNLDAAGLAFHLVGDASFETTPTGMANNPVFNHVNCDACHQRDGRDSLPVLPHKPELSNFSIKDENGWHKLNDEGTFLRISIENDAIKNAPKSEANCWGSPVAVPNFSDQLFHRGAPGVREGAGNVGAGQADVWMKYGSKTVTYPDGEKVELTYPIIKADNPYDAPDDPRVYNPIKQEANATSRLFKDDVKFGIRIGMPMIGLGLLDAVPEAAMLALADPDDKDGDGISGRANWVCDKVKYDICKAAGNCDTNPPISIGRYGWKANTPTVVHQGLGAMRGDMGVTNLLFKDESIKGTDLMATYKATHPEYTSFEDTGVTDVDDEFAKSSIFYLETLSVPPRRDIKNSDVQQGAMQFEKIGCVKCHNPSFTTVAEHRAFSVDGARIPQLENQKIYPFTDGLLHDMGDDLGDGRQDSLATGNEWKTRPLWGIGATQTVNPGAGFLHDGRARTLEEAVLWHDGEALGVKTLFMNLSKKERDQVVKFLESL